MTSDLPGALASLGAIAQFAKDAVAARDWAKLAELSAKLNEQIVKAQQAVIDGQRAQSDLVAELAEANEKIRELETAIARQAQHVPVELAPWRFALLVKDAPSAPGLFNSSDGPSKQYACQRCFAVEGKSILLQFGRSEQMGIRYFRCPNCSGTIEVL